MHVKFGGESYFVRVKGNGFHYQDLIDILSFHEDSIYAVKGKNYDFYVGADEVEKMVYFSVSDFSISLLRELGLVRHITVSKIGGYYIQLLGITLYGKLLMKAEKVVNEGVKKMVDKKMSVEKFIEKNIPLTHDSPLGKDYFKYP